MNDVITELKKEFQEDFSFKKEYLTYEEYRKLLDSSENVELGTEINDAETKYYKKVKVELTKEELQEYFFMKNLELTNRMLNNQRMMNEKLNTMKSIMIFWFIITLINICCVIYMAVKIADMFGNL